MSRLRLYLQLVRFPNLFTAMADIMAGAWAAAGLSGHPFSLQLVYLLASTTCLYAMGVVLNDYYDREIDRIERPERPIPSGKIPPSTALQFGVLLGIAGIGFAALASLTSFIVALLILALIWLYDRYAKHHAFYGPVTMGICRGFNLLLGISLVPGQMYAYWWLSAFGMIYITSVTLMARGEVGDGLYPVRVKFVAFVILLCSAGVFMIRTSLFQWVTLLAVAFFLSWTFSGVKPALQEAIPPNIRRAVGKCIVALPLLDAALASPFGGWIAFVSVIVFLFFSYSFAKLFAVT